MKTKILSLVIAIFFGTSIFAANTTDTASAKTGSAQAQKDGEIIAFIMAVDKNEIAGAKEALKKQTIPAIQQYAQMLKAQHTRNLKEALRLSKKMGVPPIKTAAVISLQEDGAKELATLSPLKDKAFEKAYVNAMVTGHAKVLKIVDSDLKNVSNPSLKKFLLVTRHHVAHHLQQGEIIQKELN